MRGSSPHPTVAIARVQRHLDLLHEYFDSWKIKVNASKTKFMIITKTMKHLDISSLQLFYGQDAITRVSETKVMGVWIDDKIGFKPHVT